MMSSWIDIPANRKRLQAALNAKLGLDPPLEIDGNLGPKSEAAITAYRQKFNVRLKGPLPYAGIFDAGLRDSLSLNPETTKMEPTNNWLSSLVASTAGKYLIAMIATWIANKLGLDPTTGHVTVEGVLVQLVGVAAGLWGMWEASKSKIVVNGTKVNLAKADLTPADKAAVATIVAKNT